MLSQEPAVQRRSIVDVIAFIDWNSQRIKFGSELKNESDSSHSFELMVLEKSLNRISEVLYHKFPDKRFSINIRLYGGWHDGIRPTRWRESIARIRDHEIAQLSYKNSIVYKKLDFGDRSLYALDSRLIDDFPCHFPGTLRTINKSKKKCNECGHSGKVMHEKMVDTALVSDVIYCATNFDDEWLIIIGEDIDLIPGIYAAERIFYNTDRKVFFMRSADHWCVKCNDLILN